MNTYSVLSAWQMSKAAYNQNKALHIAVQEQCGLEHVSSFEQGSCYADAYLRDNMVAIFFRGTDDAMDALKDMRMTPQSTVYGKRHKGVGEDYVDLLYPQVNDWLESNARGKLVSLGGHSLGGMAATDMAAKLCPFFNLALVTTFGAGRVHYKQAQGTFMAMGTKFLRFENATDPVVELPHPFPLPYRHPSKAYSIGEKGIARWRILRLLGRVKYHLMDGKHGYRQAIEPIKETDCFTLAVNPS